MGLASLTWGAEQGDRVQCQCGKEPGLPAFPSHPFLAGNKPTDTRWQPGLPDPPAGGARAAWVLRAALLRVRKTRKPRLTLNAAARPVAEGVGPGCGRAAAPFCV